jgi:hypothetical protein
MVVSKTNGRILRIYRNEELLCIHGICAEKGCYITREEHKPPYKQNKSEQYYRERMEQIGPHAVLFMKGLQDYQPRHWHALVRGILSLKKRYDCQSIDLACKRALSYSAYSYREVRDILSKGLQEHPPVPELPKDLGGYGHTLTTYDQL